MCPELTVMMSWFHGCCIVSFVSFKTYEIKLNIIYSVLDLEVTQILHLSTCEDTRQDHFIHELSDTYSLVKILGRRKKLLCLNYLANKKFSGITGGTHFTSPIDLSKAQI